MEGGFIYPHVHVLRFGGLPIADLYATENPSLTFTGLS